MAKEDQFWNREELYDEVWSTPMTKLAKKYDMLDVSLARVCRELEIPRPGRGYWAKKRAGHQVERVPLPPATNDVKIWKPRPRKPTPPEPEPDFKDAASGPEIAQVERLENAGGEFVPRDESLNHPLITQARSVLTLAGERTKKILETQEQCLNIRVSKESLERALKIMAGFISTLESEGFSVEVGGVHPRRTVAMIHGQQISFGLTEEVERIRLKIPRKGKVLEKVLAYSEKPGPFEPTGELSIEVRGPQHISQGPWTDSKSASLEEQLSRIVAGFIRIALLRRAEEEENARKELEKQRRAEERARLAEAIKVEKSKVRALRRASVNWCRAEQIRSFVSAARDSAVQNGKGVEPGTPFGDWLTWAEEQADRLDPLKESPASVVDRAGEVVSEGTSSYRQLQKPRPPFRFPKPIWRME
jgi:hypothetical protein